MGHNIEDVQDMNLLFLRNRIVLYCHHVRYSLETYLVLIHVFVPNIVHQ